MKCLQVESEGKILSFFRQHPALFAAFLATGMLLSVYVALGIWPFGEGSVITGDLNAQYLPFYAHFQRVFSGESGLFYGFDKNLGGPLIALFAYYLTSPLNFLYLLVPVRGFSQMAALVFLLKVVLAAASMSLFLHKKFPKLGLLGVVPALGYAFSAYVFVYAQNIMWHDVLILLPLVCLALERLLCGKNILPYVLLLALSIWANFYIAFMACLFLLLYTLCFLILQNPRERKFLRSFLRFVGASLLAGGLVAVLLVPTVLNLSTSKLNPTGFSFLVETQFSLLHLPEQLAFNNFQWDNVINGNPLLYCGLPLSLLAVCFFAGKGIPRLAKFCAAALLLVLVLSFWIVGIDSIWHGFARPVWFLYRYSWLFCFVISLLSAAVLANAALEKRSIFLSALFMSALFLCLILFSLTAGTEKLALSALASLAYALLLFLYVTFKTTALRRVFAGILVLLLCFELSLSAFLISRKFEPYPVETYQEFIVDVGTQMQNMQEDTPLYRVEKNFYRTMNDPMLLGYHGVSHFSSTQDNAATDTLWNLGYRGNGSYLYGSTAFSDSVLSISQLLSRPPRTVPAHWQEIGETGEGVLHENPYALPMFFTAPLSGQESELSLWEDSFAYQNALYQELSGAQTPLLLPVEQVQREFGGEVLPELTGVLPAEGEYVLQAEESGYYYALAVSDTPYADMEWLVNEVPGGRVFTADQNGVLNLGYFEAEEEIRLLFWKEVNIQNIYFAYLSPETLSQLSQEAQENSGDFTLEDGRVSGEITAVAGREFLFTSIPYDPGWQAEVNGQSVETFAVLGGLMAVPLQEGENEVLLTFSPPGLFWGMLISLASLLVLLVLFFWRKRPNWFLLKALPPTSKSQKRSK